MRTYFNPAMRRVALKFALTGAQPQPRKVSATNDRAAPSPAIARWSKEDWRRLGPSVGRPKTSRVWRRNRHAIAQHDRPRYDSRSTRALSSLEFRPTEPPQNCYISASTLPAEVVTSRAK